MQKESIDVAELLRFEIPSMPVVSIIIPVYNVEQYLERCLESVLAQTYRNLEIILVDDGSLDNSGSICDAYSKKDSRIRVIHQSNKGSSAARNEGIAAAEGRYITFLDSDDEIVNEYVQIMVAAAVMYHADIVQTRIRIEENGDCYHIENKSNIEVLLCQPGKNAANDMRYKVAAYAKLYSMPIVKNNLFPGYRIYEDDASYYRFAYESQKVCILDYYTYIYYQTDNSIMRSCDKKKDKKTDYIQIYYDRIDFFRERNEKELLLGSRNRFCLIVMLNYASYKKNATNKKDLPELLRVFREQYSYIRGTKTMGFVRACAYWMFYHFPNTMASVISLLRK